MNRQRLIRIALVAGMGIGALVVGPLWRDDAVRGQDAGAPGAAERAPLRVAAKPGGEASPGGATSGATVPVSARPEVPELKVEEKDAPGLALTFLDSAGAERNTPSENHTDTRVSRMAALYVPAGQPPSVGMPGVSWVATFEGFLSLRLRDTYTFSAEGRGEVVVTINDKEALKLTGDWSKAVPAEPIRLNKGKNKLVIKYTRPADGDAAFRLLWTVKGETYPHPIPPTMLSHNAGGEAVAKGMRLREGRQLVADLRCLQCHTSSETAASMNHPATRAVLDLRASVMPELTMDTPSLTHVGGRLNKDWLTAWINNPASLRPTAHMPRVFKLAGGGDENAIDPRAADVAAYLASLKDDKVPVADTNADDAKIARGGQLFTHLNCNACHVPPGADANANAQPAPEGEAAPPARVPLAYVKAKFQPAALVQFLLNPSTHYQWIAMPNFKFDVNDAEALATFLLSEAAGELPANLPAGDPAKGKQLVASAGCISCHSIGSEKSTLTPLAFNAIPKEGWSRGCLTPDDAGRKTAPDFKLTESQRAAIVALAATDRSSLRRDNPAEFAARQIKSLNCAACHARDGVESLLATAYDAEHKELEQKFPAPKGEHAEAFAPDQRAPLMTWFGEKLRPEWSAKFIAGEISYKPRPYLHARMPAFPARANLLAAGMAHEHGVGPEPANPKPDAETAAIGSKLAGRAPNASFSCTQCHSVGKQPPFAPFEAPAVNFAWSSERLRKDYYHRWVHNPLKLDPTSKMPAFEREDGKTTITAHYDGDARKQFEAIWQYLLEGQAIKPPAE